MLCATGVIQAVKTAEVDPAKGQSVSITKYAVRSVMDGGAMVQSGPQQQRQQLREYSEVDLIGPGFQTTAGLTLQPGQKVYITFTGREVAGHVTKHRPDVDEVHITLQASNSVIQRAVVLDGPSQKSFSPSAQPWTHPALVMLR